MLTLKSLKQNDWHIPPETFNSTSDIIEYEKINGIQAVGQHLIKTKHAGKEFTDPMEAIFRIPGADKMLSTEDVAGWYLFSRPEQLNKIKADGSSSLVDIHMSWPSYDAGLEFKDIGGTWVPLMNIRIQLRIKRHLEQLEWNMVEYFQLDWGDGIAWAMKGEAIAKGKKLVVVMPMTKEDNGTYSLGFPRVIGDFEAFLQVGNKVSKATNFDGN